MLIARRPRSSLPSTLARSWAGGGAARKGQARGPVGSGPLPSTGAPRPLTTRPQPGLGRPQGRRLGDQLRLAAQPDPFQGAEGQGQGAVAAQPHDLAVQAPAVAQHDLAAVADRGELAQPGDLHQHADHPGDTAVVADLGKLPEVVDQVAQRQSQNLCSGLVSYG